MLEMLGDPNTHGHMADKQNLIKSKTKNAEETIVERGVISVFRALSKNCNSAVYKVC